MPPADLDKQNGGVMDKKINEPGLASNTEYEADDLLENLGYKPELQRNRSTLQVAFMSFVLASIPYGLATTLIYPLIGGGPVNVIWGWVAVSLIIVCVASSLGEITSVYPTAGGTTKLLPLPCVLSYFPLCPSLPSRVYSL
jgi:amino acid permease